MNGQDPVSVSLRVRRRAIVLALSLLSFSAADAPAPVTTVPFVFLHHELVVNARVAGLGPYPFLLDSGTTPSVIDAALVKRLGLPSKGAPGRGTDLGSSSSSSTAYPITVRDLQFGALHVPRLDGLALDISGLGKQLGVPLAGVFGSNFFDGRVVQVDFPCRKISILKERPARYTARFREIASGWIVTNDVWVGRRRISAAIDTGNSGVPIVTGHGIAALHLQAAARAGKTVRSFSYGGQHNETLGVLDGVRLGSKPLGSLKVRFLPKSDGQFDINIGNQTLQHFVVTFDYVRGLLTLDSARACPTS